MRRNTILRTPVALAAAIALLGACSASGADTDDTADTTRSSGSTPSSSTTVAEESSAPDVLALPGPDPGTDSVTLPGGRYRIPLSDTRLAPRHPTGGEQITTTPDGVLGCALRSGLRPSGVTGGTPADASRDRGQPLRDRRTSC